MSTQAHFWTQHDEKHVPWCTKLFVYDKVYAFVFPSVFCLFIFFYFFYSDRRECVSNRLMMLDSMKKV